VLESHYQKYKDQGFKIITLMETDANQQPSSATSAARWRSEMNLNYIVVSVSGGTGLTLFPAFAGYPSFKMMSVGMVVTAEDVFPVTDNTIMAALP